MHPGNKSVFEDFLIRAQPVTQRGKTKATKEDQLQK